MLLIADAGQSVRGKKELVLINIGPPITLMGLSGIGFLPNSLLVLTTKQRRDVILSNLETGGCYGGGENQKGFAPPCSLGETVKKKNLKR